MKRLGARPMESKWAPRKTIYTSKFKRRLGPIINSYQFFSGLLNDMAVFVKVCCDYPQPEYTSLEGTEKTYYLQIK